MISEFGQPLLVEASESAIRMPHSRLNFHYSFRRGFQVTVCALTISAAIALSLNFDMSSRLTTGAVTESSVRARAAGPIAEHNPSITLPELASHPLLRLGPQKGQQCLSKDRKHYDPVQDECVCDAGYYYPLLNMQGECVKCTSEANQHWDDSQESCVCDDGHYYFAVLPIRGGCTEFKFGVVITLNVLVLLSVGQCCICMFVTLRGPTIDKTIHTLSGNMESMNRKFDMIISMNTLASR